MKISNWTMFSTAIAGAAMAAALSMPAQALAATHDHDAAAPHRLTLNQGSKWATDAPLRAGMQRIRDLVEPQLGAAHAGRLTPAQGRGHAGTAGGRHDTAHAQARRSAVPQG